MTDVASRPRVNLLLMRGMEYTFFKMPVLSTGCLGSPRLLRRILKTLATVRLGVEPAF